jgi:hypothetical protein
LRHRVSKKFLSLENPSLSSSEKTIENVLGDSGEELDNSEDSCLSLASK